MTDLLPYLRQHVVMLRTQILTGSSTESVDRLENSVVPDVDEGSEVM